jgi:hypothetical protein
VVEPQTGRVAVLAVSPSSERGEAMRASPVSACRASHSVVIKGPSGGEYFPAGRAAALSLAELSGGVFEMRKLKSHFESSNGTQPNTSRVNEWLALCVVS